MTAPDYSTPDPGDPYSLEQDFAELIHAIGRLSVDCPARLEQDDTLDAAVLLLADLREQRKLLATVEAYVEAQAAQRMPRNRAQVADLLVERKGGTIRRDWRTDALAWAVVREFTVTPDGEVDEAATELVGLVRDRLVNCARLEWRTTQLRELGLNPDDYATVERGRRTVVLTPVLDEADAA